MSAKPTYNEADLLQQIAEGEEKAFATLFEHYRDKVYRVAYRLTASETNAQEMVQDVFLKVWNNRRKLTEVENFDSYLFIITRNTVYSHFRTKASKQVHIPIVQDDLVSVPSMAETAFQEKEYQVYLSQAISKLPQRQKQVYELNKDLHLSYKAIAQQLNISPETVKVHLQLATRSVRAYLLARMDLGILLLILWKNNF